MGLFDFFDEVKSKVEDGLQELDFLKDQVLDKAEGFVDIETVHGCVLVNRLII